MAVSKDGCETSIRSRQVKEALDVTSGVIERWIRRAEEDQSCPVWNFSSTQEMRTSVALPSVSQQSHTDEELYECMSMILDNSVNPWTGRFVDKLYTAPTTKGPAFEALLAAINANAHVLSAAPMLCLAEEACVEQLSVLCGWNADQADGLTMPGGSSSNTFAVQTALNTLLPCFKEEGVVGAMQWLQRKTNRSLKACRPLIFTGKDGHYSLEKAAMACGLGLNCVVKVECDEYGAMDCEALDKLLHQAFANSQGDEESKDIIGWPVFVNATAGSTVTGSFDPLEAMANVCAKYDDLISSTTKRLWRHVDGSWGGPVLFSDQHKGKMQGVDQFDSFTINPHKLLNIPHQCSFVIFRVGDAMANNALDAPYLFHADTSKASTTNDHSSGVLQRKLKRRESPAMMNFGCGRRGDALKFYLAWLSLGSRHFGRQVDEGIAKAQEVVRRITSEESLRNRLEVSQAQNLFLQVCFRPTLLSTSAIVAEKSKATQFVHATLRHRRRFAVDFAPLGKGQGDFIRMVTHPSSTIATLMELVHEVAAIGDEYVGEGHANH